MPKDFHIKNLFIGTKLLPLVSYLLENNGITTTDMAIAKILRKSRATIIRHKEVLVASGVIKVDRGRYSSTWTVLNADVATSEPEKLQHLEQEVATSGLSDLNTTTSKATKINKSINTLSLFNKESLNTLSKSNTLSVVKANDTKANVKRDKDKDDNVEKNKLRGKTKSPSLPVEIKETLEVGHIFPYEKEPVGRSVIWYWAVERYKKHKLNLLMTPDLFRTMILKLNRTLNRIWKNDFEKQKNYIDWYLNRTDDFTAKTTRFGFEFMVSTSCYNKYLADKDSNTKIIFTEEQRKANTGRWIR